jgi:N-acetylneuraminate synthase/N,N'-diacetyllegionaminate synthase
VVSPAAPKAGYQLETTGHAESQAEMIRKLELRAEDHPGLMQHCEERGILFLSTPFDEESADFLAGLGVAAFKTSSGDVNNLPFLEHLARIGRPIIFSTGMSYLAEVEEALHAMIAAGGRSIAVLHCVSDYPTSPGDVNLRALDTLSEKFPAPVGFSDHTLGMHLAVAAVARGACAIEKHFTLDRTLPGPDHRASLEPAELKQMITMIRETEAALGDGVKIPRGGEIVNINVARKSLHWRRAVGSGEAVTSADFIALRPGNGVSPARLRSLLGKRTAAAVSAGAIVREEDFSA